MSQSVPLIIISISAFVVFLLIFIMGLNFVVRRSRRPAAKKNGDRSTLGKLVKATRSIQNTRQRRREVRLEKAYSGHRTFRRFISWSEVEYRGVVIERWDYMPWGVAASTTPFYRVRIPGVDPTCNDGDVFYVHGMRKALTLTEAVAEAKKQSKRSKAETKEMSKAEKRKVQRRKLWAWMIPAIPAIPVIPVKASVQIPRFGYHNWKRGQPVWLIYSPTKGWWCGVSFSPSSLPYMGDAAVFESQMVAEAVAKKLRKTGWLDATVRTLTEKQAGEPYTVVDQGGKDKSAWGDWRIEERDDGAGLAWTWKDNEPEEDGKPDES